MLNCDLCTFVVELGLVVKDDFRDVLCTFFHMRVMRWLSKFWIPNSQVDPYTLQRAFNYELRDCQDLCYYNFRSDSFESRPFRRWLLLCKNWSRTNWEQQAAHAGAPYLARRPRFRVYLIAPGNNDFTPLHSSFCSMLKYTAVFTTMIRTDIERRFKYKVELFVLRNLTHFSGIFRTVRDLCLRIFRWRALIKDILFI